MKKKNTLELFDQTAQIFLNIFALLNIPLLFFHVLSIEEKPLSVYTLISIFVLIFHLILRAIFRHISLKNFYEFIPDAFFVIVGLTINNSMRVFQFYLLGRQTFLLIKNLSMGKRGGKFFDKLAQNPPVFVLFSFLFAIFIGTLFLLLPGATVASEETSLIGALFTSTSATCVTGLIVYDTGTHFTLFGQLVILLLIQIGGLGIMTVSSAFAIMLGQKLSIRSENLIQNVVGETNKVDMINLIKHVLIVTFFFEIIGALFLYLTFRGDFISHYQALYYSLFHSVSAFCNAGFSLFPDSFMSYLSNFNINFVITSLIIIGGIGFPVIVDIRRNFFRTFKLSRLSLHTKIVLSSSALLLLIGFAAFFVSEYNSEMKDFGMLNRIYASYFQSVTTRTAGFNTIDNANLSPASVLASIILMFIGASPGSTGGGIKTTAFAVILISVIVMFKGNRETHIFHRKVSENIIRKVMALIASSVLFLSFMIFLLLLIEPFSFQQTVFEAFSAFGTVGLSMGITAQLSIYGKIIIILLMYLGRVGPLTLIFAISETKTKTSYSYTEEKIAIG
ncbi:MAG: potassium transporter Trk [Candidatus Cloacimonadota bacterium]|nr:MAG: potassium transporter Trk [Candidatus Cloacimonadota bacterium]